MKIRQIEYADVWPLNLPWQEDPVRPELDREFRHTAGREVYTNGGAIICVAYCTDVPRTIQDLNSMIGLDHAVFYTVWSRQAGAGRLLVTDLWKQMLMTQPHIKRYVTLSPKTKMAWNFHINNGARLLYRNEESDNYEYSEAELIRDKPLSELKRQDGGSE
jgi:hypothetical protein|tara:strand:+ start:185 stop:667 length:483 start_codon:yes stop_codon:yes gene_type:complete